jgi:hypothetical protein
MSFSFFTLVAGGTKPARIVALQAILIQSSGFKTVRNTEIRTMYIPA